MIFDLKALHYFQTYLMFGPNQETPTPLLGYGISRLIMGYVMDAWIEDLDQDVSEILSYANKIRDFDLEKKLLKSEKRDPFFESLAALNKWQSLCPTDKKKHFNTMVSVLSHPQINNCEGYTALMYFTDKKNLRMVQRLIKAGADINLSDENGLTALMKASHSGNVEIVKELIEAGAKVDAMHFWGGTALKYAPNPEIVPLLNNAFSKQPSFLENLSFFKTYVGTLQGQIIPKEIILLVQQYGIHEMGLEVKEVKDFLRQYNTQHYTMRVTGRCESEEKLEQAVSKLGRWDEQPTSEKFNVYQNEYQKIICFLATNNYLLTNRNHSTALTAAVVLQKTRLTQALIKAGANPQYETPLLVYAAKHVNNPSINQTLRDAGVNLESEGAMNPARPIL